MSDPVVEAVQRAVQVTRERRGETFQVDGAEIYELLCDIAEDAAREALKPIRELHQPIWDNCINACCSGEQCVNRYRACAAGCDDEWPCDTAKLIYTTEELGA